MEKFLRSIKKQFMAAVDGIATDIPDMNMVMAPVPLLGCMLFNHLRDMEEEHSVDRPRSILELEGHLLVLTITRMISRLVFG